MTVNTEEDILIEEELALTAATAGAAGAVLITQDKHFDRLRDLVEVKKPDDLFR